MSKLKKFLIIVLCVIVAFGTAVGIYSADYYRADNKAVDAMSYSDSAEDFIVFGDDDSDCGLIFYPGGKVEYTAYAPLLKSLAQKGIMCVLVEMPLNLAVFDINAADGIQQHFPDVKSWYMAGHSLGGSMAASYIAENSDDFNGLILLASYSTSDLNNSDLKVASIYGSEDKVLNVDKYNEYRSNLPADTEETVIEGGCHAYFGSYGPQDGDGTPSISREEQIELTTNAILEFVKHN